MDDFTRISGALLIAYCTLLAASSDPEWSARLNRRLASHFGPFLAPSVVHSKTYQEAKKMLTKGLLLSGERSHAVAVIESVSMRKEVMQADVLPAVLSDLTSPPSPGTGKTADQFDALLRVTLDLLSSTRPDEREVDLAVMERLTTSNPILWGNDPWNEEIKARVLFGLLECEQNARTVVGSQAVHAYLYSPGSLVECRSFHPYRKKLYGSETHDYKRACIDLIRKSTDMIGEWPRPDPMKRVSPNIHTKLTARSFEVMLGTAAMYSVVTYASRLSALSQIEFSTMGRLTRNTVLAVTGLELLYRGEEAIINSKPYNENKATMYGLSLGMVCMHAALGTALYRLSFPVLGPFFMIRIFRDAYADAYRS
jgi:hypothetical protein